MHPRSGLAASRERHRAAPSHPSAGAARLLVLALVAGVSLPPRPAVAQGGASAAGRPADGGGAAAVSGASLLASLLPSRLREALRASAAELTARRAALAAAEARQGAVGFAAPVVLALENEESPNGRLARGNTRVELARDFLTGGRRQAARAVAATDVVAARAALEAAERRVLARGARAFALAVGWRAVAGRLAAQDALLASAETSLRTRFAVGDARYVDVLRLRTERLRVQTERATAVTEGRTGLVALAALLGGDTAATTLPSLSALPTPLGTTRGDTAAASLFTAATLPPAPPLEALVALAADVRQAAAQVERATAARQLVLANQRPAVSATVGVQRVGPDGDGSASVGPVLGASVSLPFTARRANQAASAAAARDIVAARAARDATAAAVRGALAVARERYEAARERLAGYDATLLRAAGEERESALAAYRTGDLSLLELVDFERALSRAEIDRLRAGLDALTALTDLLSGAPSTEGTTDLAPLTGTAGGTE